MYKEEKDYYYIDRFKKNGITAVYTKKSLGNMSNYCESDDNPAENRTEVLKKLELSDRIEVESHQTHSNNIKIIDKHVTKYSYYGIDGFVTDRKDVALFTFYADCLPIFIYDMENGAIGVAHSGWPGTYKEIQKNLVETMTKKYGTNPKNTLLALGIGISVSDYEVGVEFYEKFAKKFDRELIENSFIYSKKKSKYYFDNIGFNKIIALRMGFSDKNIITASESTLEEKFHSHRREGKASGRATALIAFQ
jgi:YfiH family protein